MVVLSSANKNNLPTLDSRTVRARPEGEPQAGRRRITAKDRQRIVELYGSGLSSRAVAAELHVSKASVLNVLKSALIELRPPGKRSVD